MRIEKYSESAFLVFKQKIKAHHRENHWNTKKHYFKYTDL